MTYRCEYQNKVKSVFSPRQSVNLFTAATYDTNGKKKSILVVTNSQDKDKNSAFIFIIQLVYEIKFQAEQELIGYLQGLSSELRNKVITRKLKANVQWKYFATSHGKDVADVTGDAAKVRL